MGSLSIQVLISRVCCSNVVLSSSLEYSLYPNLYSTQRGACYLCPSGPPHLGTGLYHCIRMFDLRCPRRAISLFLVACLLLGFKIDIEVCGTLQLRLKQPLLGLL